ncbi:MAG: ParB/RepB/Spo0J family partition protein [Stenomitos frigidus ULC029]
MDNTVEKQVEYQPAKMRVVRMSLADLIPDPANPRKGKVKVIAESLKEFGQHKPIVVQESTNRILIGNHTFKAAQALGWSEIDVNLVTDDDLKALRRSLVDNRASDVAGYNEDELKELLKLPGMEELPGFDTGFLDKLFAEKEGAADTEDDPTYPITPKFGESYHAVVIFADNDTDWTFLQTVLNLQHHKSYKNGNVSLCQVITAIAFGELWRNRA